MKRIITMAALSAAFLVTPACNSGGGGGGGGKSGNNGDQETMEEPTTPGTSTQGYAPKDIAALSWMPPGGTTFSYTLYNGRVQCRITYPNTITNAEGTYTYTKLSDNMASLEMSMKKIPSNSMEIRDKFMLHFVSPNEAEATIVHTVHYHQAGYKDESSTDSYNLRIPVTPR